MAEIKGKLNFKIKRVFRQRKVRWILEISWMIKIFCG